MNDEQNIPEKIIPESPNFQTELAAQIADIAPQIVSDGKLDVNKLRELVNGDAETAPEKFGLFWPGKQRAQAVAQLPTTATLKPAPEESVDWDTTKNIFIEGDNLEVLKTLQDSYRRKIKMIYIDPPYNTGKEFIYPDNFQEGLKTYLEYTGQKSQSGEIVESKKETGGRKHSGWLNMMYPRLQLAKSLLTNDGVIFISIGSDEIANLHELCNEVFVDTNYVDTLIVRSNPRGNQAKKHTASQHEYVLVFARDIGNLPPLGHNRTNDVYNRSDENGEYREIGLRKRGAGSRRIDAPNQYYPIYFSLESKLITTKPPTGNTIAILPMLSDGTEGRWRWAHKTVDENVDKLIVREVNKRNGEKGYDVFEKDYFDAGKNVKIKSLLLEKEYNYENATADIRELFGGKKVFPYTKPKELILNLIDCMSLRDGDIILDFFAGSSTTAHSAFMAAISGEVNISSIMVQLPEEIDQSQLDNKDALDYCKENNIKETIAEISKERIRRSAKKILTDFEGTLKDRKSRLDTGFKVYKLTSSNFADWNENEAAKNPTQAIMNFADNKKSDAKPEDILAEIMLRSRITLDAKIEKKNLSSGGWVYIVDGGRLIAFVDDAQLTVEQATEIAEMSPAKFVALDSAFNGNDALKINIANICRDKHVGEFKTI